MENRADNSAGITCGGAHCLYKPPVHDMPRISSVDSEAALATSTSSNSGGLPAGNDGSVPAGGAGAVNGGRKPARLPKEWKFPTDLTVDDAIVEACGSPILAKLLIRRGLRTPAEVAAFLDPEQYVPSGPMELPDMARAVVRVTQAIENKEKITIYGDYDVDGVTATSVMVTTLRQLGADVDYYIPTRAEGYGLNLKAVSVLASKHRTKLIISCDCGISNFAEINFAKSLGVDTIVVDHHTMPDLMPPAAAILHPKQLAEDHPLFHLPGVGVAFKLAEALLLDRGESERIPLLLDLVTLGMIADMVPLVKECRYLVQIGMPRLVGSERAGIKALLAQVGARDGGTDLVGFGLAPRINAVGRLSDANAAVQLMITEDEEQANELARQLEYENLRRQELCEEIFKKADQAAMANVQAGDKAIAIYSEGWHHGVVGIVASRLVEKYHCPVFIGELDPTEGIVKGSARGIEGIDLYDVLKANEHLALKWGGHKMAAGFSVEVGKAELFCKGIVETCNRHLAEKPLVPTLQVDLDAAPAEVSMDLATLLARMAPFGIGNKKPVIAMRGLKCSSSRPLGKEAKHSRIVVKSDDGQQFECVYWNSAGRVPADGSVVDVAFAPDINTYNGVSRLQLILNDWRDPNQPVTPVVVHKPSGQVSTISLPGGKPPSGDTQAAPDAPSPAAPSVSLPAGTVIDAAPDRKLVLKDLRNHATPQSVLDAAVRKLGPGINLFGEGVKPLGSNTFIDRTVLQPTGHLLLWQYPPALAVLKGIVAKSAASNIYLVGAADSVSEDASAFLRRLLGLVRFAVNQREGQAHPERMAAAMSATKMTVALGLTILKKINVVDWFAEDGCVYLDILGQPSDKPEQLPEFRQLNNCLKEIVEFRNWCHSADVSEIQLALAPAPSVSQPSQAYSAAPTPSGTGALEQDTSGIYHHDTANELPSSFS